MKPTSFQHYLEGLHERVSANRAGAVADYIPELTKVDPEGFGIAIVTVDGHVYQVGDTKQPFSIQSISKAFTYGIALEDKGEALVATKIDVEPSGEAFNSISLEPSTGRPRNPMINAGAIVATSLVDGDTGPEKLARILDRFARYTGRPLEVDEAIYLSEKGTGHRNRAIAHLLRNYDILETDPEEPLDAYFRQCSILVNARDLASMGACLANDGVNPITGVRALESAKVPKVLSVMATCGMYDYSGEWIYRVGMPAKSGVGGGVVAVLPGQLGLAIFSPRLDEKGNSVRGIAVCEALSEDFGLHMLRVTRSTTSSVIRASYTGARVRSKINRDPESERHLDQAGDNVQVVELSGELMFVSAEAVAATAIRDMENRRFLVLDLARVTAIDRSASTLLRELVRDLEAQGKRVFITGTGHHYGFRRFFGQGPGTSADQGLFEHPDVDHALEFVEEVLLDQLKGGEGDERWVPFSAQPLCRDFTDEELALLETLLEEKRYAAGESVIAEGDPSYRLYFLSSGRVSASIRLDHKRRHRLSTSAAGWAFGEAALFGSGPRTADVLAETDVFVYRLDVRRLRELETPLAREVQLKIMRNFAEITLARLARATREIRSLTS